MLRRFSSPVGLAALATATLLVADLNAHGHSGGHGGAGHGGAAHHHAGFHHGGFGGFGGFSPFFGPGFFTVYGVGFYRPYYGYGLGGLGGVGGLGLGGYGLGGYGLGGYGSYLPYSGGYGGAPIAGAIAPNGPAGQPPAQTPPPPDNAAHLQLVVPTNAEVLFNGEATTQTGRVREFVSPMLTPGKVFAYTIAVRYPGADGKPIDDRRVIQVRANDWFRIDFTRPAPPERAPAPPEG